MTDTPQVVIEGVAPVEVRTIRVFINGEDPREEAIVRFVSTTDWMATVVLPEGKSSLSFFAFASDGDLLASDRIDMEFVVARFVRGDVNLSGRLDISDALLIVLDTLGRDVTLPCLDAADSNDDGRLALNDAFSVLLYVFLNGAPLPAPFPNLGEDPTPDRLGCDMPLP